MYKRARLNHGALPTQAKYLPKRTTPGDTKLFERREEDLNGVNPLYAALGAAVAGSMSYGAWQVRSSSALWDTPQ